MRIHTFERAFLWTGAIMLVVFGATLTYTSVSMGIHLPGAHGRIDPATARQTPPFDQPGLREVEPGKYQLVLVAQAWSFTPAEIHVPAGSEVTIVATSLDVIHGLHIDDTRVNMMLIPGQVAENTYRFEHAGEHLLVCHEYCGAGHHFMFGKVVVE